MHSSKRAKSAQLTFSNSGQMRAKAGKRKQYLVNLQYVVCWQADKVAPWMTFSNHEGCVAFDAMNKGCWGELIAFVPYLTHMN